MLFDCLMLEVLTNLLFDEQSGNQAGFNLFEDTYENVENIRLE